MGEMQKMMSNDSQVHSHFGNYTHVEVPNIQSLGWKGKQAPNWVAMIPLELSWSLNA
jgi:hypothetical protein